MPHDPATLAALTHLEEAQAALGRTMKAVAPARLAARPPSGEWSPMENLRHLVFAEQHHFKPYLPRGFRWSGAGVPPPNRTGERRLTPVGSDPAATVDDVLDAWMKVHAVVRALCLESADDLSRNLLGNLRHVAVHAAAIERLLRGSGA